MSQQLPEKGSGHNNPFGANRYVATQGDVDIRYRVEVDFNDIDALRVGTSFFSRLCLQSKKAATTFPHFFLILCAKKRPKARNYLHIQYKVVLICMISLLNL